MKAASKSSAAGVERGLEMRVGRCGCKETKGFRYHKVDTLSTNGRKEGKGKKEGREGDRKAKE